MLKKVLLATTFALSFASNALAGGVTGWGASDGFSATPLDKGKFAIDFRVNGGIPGISVAPTLNVVWGAVDTLEVGVGGTLNLAGIGGTAPINFSSDTVYPWVRGQIAPLSNAKFKLGYMVGSLFPAYNTQTEIQPGVSLLADVIGTDWMTASLNAGYSRTLKSNANIVSGNLNFTFSVPPVAGLSIYEEQYINYFLGSPSNGGVRLGFAYQPSPSLSFDLMPAANWAQDAKGAMSWTFAPNIGATMYF